MTTRRTTLIDGMLRAAATERGAAVVAAHDEDYEVVIEGQPRTILRMNSGAATLATETVPGFCSYTKVTIAADVLPELSAGTITPTEAVEAGRILLQSRLYGGGQFLRLMRLAQLDELGTPGGPGTPRSARQRS